jgi:hypothetical protein
MRVRSAPNRPAATLAFWQEALRTRMVDAGYKLISEAPIEASGAPGALLTLSAADGPRDLTYLVAIFVQGRHLIIAEAAGEAGQMKAQVPAVEAAIRGMGL